MFADFREQIEKVICESANKIRFLTKKTKKVQKFRKNIYKRADDHAKQQKKSQKVTSKFD